VAATLSSNQRAVDGVVAACFIRTLKTAAKAPESWAVADGAG
jgi:hypothetical protein